MLRRKHVKAKRDCSTFVLTFGSKHKIVENYKHLMLKYLNVIFDETNEPGCTPEKEQQIIQKIVKELFDIINQPKVHALVPDKLNFMERSVSADYAFNLGPKDVQNFLYPLVYIQCPHGTFKPNSAQPHHYLQGSSLLKEQKICIP